MVYTQYDGYLAHFGIKGQKWGIRRFQNEDGTLTSAGKARYNSTGFRSYIARKQNERVDRSFKRWKENDSRKQDAIQLGKDYNDKRLQYESDRKNPELRRSYKDSKKLYKKALRDNTVYRKGVVRQEVGRDASRKYLSEAKKIQKQLQANPNDKGLQKRYNDLMSKHDVERARARRAVEVAQNRSRRIASVKRSVTIGVKSAAASAAIGSGLYLLNKHSAINIQPEAVDNAIKRVKYLMKFI